MTVSLQYIQRVYGNRLRKVGRVSKPLKKQSKTRESDAHLDAALISRSRRNKVLMHSCPRGLSGSILQKKLAIKAYRNVAKTLQLLLR